MKVVAYPADNYGCGHHRLIYPAARLRELGHDVTIISSKERSLSITLEGDRVTHVTVDDDIDVIVFQRVTDWRMVGAIRWLKEHGHTTVVDVDDDLSCIHPSNPAFIFLDPHRAEHEVRRLIAMRQLHPKQAGMVLNSLQQQYTHSWNNLAEACKLASLVTLSTPGLMYRYGRRGRQVVVPNYIADHYFDVPHEDSDKIGWPAALHSHPNDPAAMGNAIARIVQEGAHLIAVGDSLPVAQAFGISIHSIDALKDVDLPEWPALIARLGIGIAPLADTKFNSSKSWLKPLELSAVGVPWVGSPRAEYVKLHTKGAGLLARDARQWYQRLHELRNDAAYRKDLSDAGRAVAMDLRWHDHAEELWNAWEYALASDRADADA